MSLFLESIFLQENRSAHVFSSRLIEDRGVLITTHEISDIEHLIDKVVLLDEGVIMKEFYAEEMREKEGMSVVDVMREAFKLKKHLKHFIRLVNFEI